MVRRQRQQQIGIVLTLIHEMLNGIPYINATVVETVMHTPVNQKTADADTLDQKENTPRWHEYE